MPNPGTCEDWIAWQQVDESGRSSYSNLAGQGPDLDKPHEIRYYGAGQLSNAAFIDVVLVVNGSSPGAYLPQNAGTANVPNKISGKMAKINVITGRSVSLKGTFVRSHTFCPEVPILPKFTFCDLDHSNPARPEMIELDGVTAVFTNDDDIGSLDYTMELFEYGTIETTMDPLTYTATSIPTLVPGRTSRKYVSSSGGAFGIKVTSGSLGCNGDSPNDPSQLSNITCADNSILDQTKRCFMVEFNNTSEFFLKFANGGTPLINGGRNLIMSGTSRFFASEDSTPCFAPPTPVPTATPSGAPTPAPTAAPTTPAPTLVSGTGDPHLTNMYGQRFDLYRAGVSVLLQIPQKAARNRTLLILEADAQLIGTECSDLYFQVVTISGRWTNQSNSLRFFAKSDGKPDSMKWTRFGSISLKVVHGHTREGVDYLNVFAKNIGRAGYPVGGLLGSDDHTEAATRPLRCSHAVNL
jgi:hypothetical protein